MAAWLFIEGGKWVARQRALQRRGTTRIRAGGGSFGGGGATGSWEPAESSRPGGAGAEGDLDIAWGEVITGDPTCPPSGFKWEWQYAVNGLGQVFGPHDNGPFTVFYGYSPPFNGALPSYAAWLPVDNASTVLNVAAGQPIDCATTGTGICSLPDPSSVVSTTKYTTLMSKPVKDSTSGGFDHYNTTRGDIWQPAFVACDPPSSKLVPVGTQAKIDRKRVPNAPTEKVREDDDDELVVPPPFVFGVVAGAPPTPPAVGEGGFRPRKPPRSRVRERKKKTALQTILKVLDVVSESSEVVDCFYKTLPKSVRRRWEKGRPNRGLLDSAGQYGINGADWKAQALWHNHKLIDWQVGLGCAAYNQVIEDKVIGAIAKRIPPQAGVVTRGFDTLKYVQEREKQNAKWARIRRENAARAAAAKKKKRAAKLEA